MTLKSQEIATTPQTPFTPENLISQALTNNLPIEALKELMAMRKELKQEKAKEAFDAAMAKFQAECPTIKKKKEGGKTKSGYVAYMYAPLEDIIEQTKRAIGQNGFSYSFKTEFPQGQIRVTCLVKHEGGHIEESTMEVPLGTKTEIMSAPQATAATVTFAKRYAFCNAFGITTGDADNDRKALPEDKYASPKQRDEIDRLAEALAISKDAMAKRFFELYSIDISKMTELQAEGVISMLKKRIDQKTEVAK